MSTWRSRKRGSDTSLAPSNRFGIESSWRDSKKCTNTVCLRWLMGLASAIFTVSPCGGLGGEIFRHIRSIALLRAHFQHGLSFYFQAIQWPPNTYLTPSEVHLLLPDLELGTLKPSRVRYASEASIKARRFLRLLLRKPATVPSCSHTINHHLSRRRVPLWELGLSLYRHKVHPMLT
jgi:hypothetical protein